MVQTILVFLLMFNNIKIPFLDAEKGHEGPKRLFQDVDEAEHRGVHIPRELQGFVDIVIDDLVVDHADADAAFAIEQSVHGVSAHPRGEDAVEGGGGAAALNAAEDLGFGFEGGFFGDALGEGVDIGVDLFGNDDDGPLFLGFAHLAEGVDDFVFGDRVIGGDDHLGAFGDAGEQGQIAAVVAHDFDDGATLMGFGGFADVVDAIADRVQAGVETDGVVGRGDVVIDRAGQADAVDAHLGELLGAHIGAVAADDDEGFDAHLLQIVDRFLADGFFFEFAQTGGLENRAAFGDDVGDRGTVHRNDVAFDEAFVAVDDAVHLQTVTQTGADDGANGAVHARRISAGSENTNFMDHKFNPSD